MDLPSGSLSGKKIVITGAVKKGIGRSIYERFISDGDVSVALLAKEKSDDTDELLQDARLKSNCDVRFFEADLTSHQSLSKAVDKIAQAFGGIDVCVHAASAMLPTTEMSASLVDKYNLSHKVNTDSTLYLASCLFPHFKLSDEANFLNICPPLDMDPRVLSTNIAYATTQYSRSLLTIALANHAEWKDNSIHVNALWPLKPSADSNVYIYQSHMEKCERSKTLEYMADAAHYVITVPRSRWQVNGEFLYDEEVLEMVGVSFANINDSLSQTNTGFSSSTHRSQRHYSNQNSNHQQPQQPYNNYISGSSDDDYL